MKRRTHLTEEDVVSIRELNAVNPRMWTRVALAAEFNVSAGTIHWILNQEGYERRKLRLRERNRLDSEVSRSKKSAGIGSVFKDTHAERDWKKQRKLIPEDTRTYTQRFFGDPLPGRSALDRRAGG